jgi:molybdopterin-biosynthesis enzyme MoeA-like protein
MSSETSAKKPTFGLIIIGDEIMSGKRTDKHLPKVIEMMTERGLQLDYAEYVGDSPERITATLKRAFDSGDVVFSTGGIGATPDDHTRHCAAKALGVELALHPVAETLIRERMQDVARENGTAYEPAHADNIHRLNMGVFPAGATTIANPYNKIPGFSCVGKTGQGAVHFVPGFPVMAWPMIAAVLDAQYSAYFQKSAYIEKSIIVFGSMEAMLTPLMLELEKNHAGIKVFSLPSVDHPTHGRHIELGVKGAPEAVALAYPAMLAGLKKFESKLGPELVR